MIIAKSHDGTILGVQFLSDNENFLGNPFKIGRNRGNLSIKWKTKLKVGKFLFFSG